MFPTKETTSHSSMHFWMNDFIRNRRDDLSKSRKRSARERKPCYSTEYKADEKAYESLVENARTTSFRKFTAEVNSAKDMADLARIIQSKDRRDLGMLRTPEGEMASSPEASAEILLDKAFPKSVPLSEEDQIY